MPIEDIHFALASNPTVFLGFCAPSSVVSVASGWCVAAVGFVVVYSDCFNSVATRVLVNGQTCDSKGQRYSLFAFPVKHRAKNTETL